MRLGALFTLLPLLSGPIARAAVVFQAPDSGPDKAPYTCSFHWLRAPDSSIVGMDVIRSDDRSELGLRVFQISTSGAIRALIYEAPTSDWQPFATAVKPDLSGPGPVIGRGTGWVAGKVILPQPSQSDGVIGFSQVVFDLDIQPLSEPRGLGDAGLAVTKMVSSDFPRARTVGWIQLDGTTIPVNSLGPVSIHYGESLPQYAYLASVPSEIPGATKLPQILISSVTQDDFKTGADWLGSGSITYLLGHAGAPPFLFSFGPYDTADVELGLAARLKIGDVHPWRHELLGLPVVTASAHGYLTVPDPGVEPWNWFREKTVDLGWVVLDNRGSYYLGSL